MWSLEGPLRSSTIVMEREGSEFLTWNNPAPQVLLVSRHSGLQACPLAPCLPWAPQATSQLPTRLLPTLSSAPLQPWRA